MVLNSLTKMVVTLMFIDIKPRVKFNTNLTIFILKFFSDYIKFCILRVQNVTRLICLGNNEPFFDSPWEKVKYNKKTNVPVYWTMKATGHNQF